MLGTYLIENEGGDSGIVPVEVAALLWTDGEWKCDRPAGFEGHVRAG
jgi:hypothetical protein